MSGRENSRREGWRNHAREAQALGEAKRYQRLMLRQAVKVTALRGPFEPLPQPSKAAALQKWPGPSPLLPARVVLARGQALRPGGRLVFYTCPPPPPHSY